MDDLETQDETDDLMTEDQGDELYNLEVNQDAPSCRVCYQTVTALIQQHTRSFARLCGCTGGLGLICLPCLTACVRQSPEVCHICRQPWRDSVRVTRRQLSRLEFNDWYEQKMWRIGGELEIYLQDCMEKTFYFLVAVLFFGICGALDKSKRFHYMVQDLHQNTRNRLPESIAFLAGALLFVLALVIFVPTMAVVYPWLSEELARAFTFQLYRQVYERLVPSKKPIADVQVVW